MGIFSFLKSPSHTFVDRVWKKSPDALRGMMTDALLDLTQGMTPVVASYFDEGQHRILQFLTSNNVPFHDLGLSPGTDPNEGVVLAFSPKLFRSAEAGQLLAELSRRRSVHLLMFGHYPLPSKEEMMLKRFATIKALSITFYSSLDEPGLEVFNPSRMIELMDKLGVKDDESIEHRMVTKAMTSARQKIERALKFDMESMSETEWFQKNAIR